VLRRALLHSVALSGWVDLATNDRLSAPKPRFVLLTPGGWLLAYNDISLDRACEHVLISGTTLALATFDHDQRLLRVDGTLGVLLLRAADASKRDTWLRALRHWRGASPGQG